MTLKSASRTLSDVGRVPAPPGAWSVLPLKRPATTRIRREIMRRGGLGPVGAGAAGRTAGAVRALSPGCRGDTPVLRGTQRVADRALRLGRLDRVADALVPEG